MYFGGINRYYLCSHSLLLALQRENQDPSVCRNPYSASFSIDSCFVQLWWWIHAWWHLDNNSGSWWKFKKVLSAHHICGRFNSRSRLRYHATGLKAHIQLSQGLFHDCLYFPLFRFNPRFYKSSLSTSYRLLFPRRPLIRTSWHYLNIRLLNKLGSTPIECFSRNRPSEYY